MFTFGRGDLGGIDNEALDFSQLEDYINDENENNIYFQEVNLVSGELKLAEPGKEQLFPLAAALSNSRSHVVLRADSSSPLTSHLTSDPSDPLTHGVSSSIHSGTVPTSPLAKAASFRARNHSVNSSFSKPHHLPDSPPDSGSEPPFSPNEDPKLSCSSSVSVDMLHHHHHQQQQQHHHQQGVEGPSRSPYLPYGQHPLKHLHDVSTATSPTSSTSSRSHQHHHSHHHHHQSPLPGAPISLQSPHSTSLPLLSIGSIHSPPAQLLNHINPTILSPIVGNSLPQQVMITPPNGHLGHLYSGGEELLYENLASPATGTPISKKRKLSDSPKPSRSAANDSIHVKSEPAVCSPDPVHSSNVSVVGGCGEDEYSMEAVGDALFVDANYQCIRFQSFQQNTWVQLLDKDMNEITSPNFRVDADKGFNFSNADESFVCQKKNHFQVTVHVQPVEEAHYVRTPEGTKPIEKFSLQFHGVKMESPTQTIKVEQSQSDRSKKPFKPVPLDLMTDQVSKTTVGRLHFSETTSNNMRKKGKPNPDQRFFFLVVSLCVHVAGDISYYPVVAHSSEKIIVRASNPGQFENDMELSWQKGHTADSIFHGGRVGINTDRPEESLVVHGNIKVTGHIVQPSDIRAKVDIHELDTREQLKNVASLRIVRYRYLPEFGAKVGLTNQLADTGVIAQELRSIIPDAVIEAGDITLDDGRLIDKLLVVNKERIFMENVGAVKELCKVTDNLENRIDELERINKKLTSIKRKDSLKSTSTDISRGSSMMSHGKRRSHRPTSKGRLSCHMTFCSNHFVQSTIVVLVLIMAFCLVALATLYIMEWQNRHWALPYRANPTISASKSSLSTTGSSKRPEWMTSSQVHPSIVTSLPSSSGSSISATITTYDDVTDYQETTQSKPFSRTTVTVSSITTTSSTKSTDNVYGVPIIDCIPPTVCPVFCCEPSDDTEEQEVVEIEEDTDEDQQHVDVKRREQDTTLEPRSKAKQSVYTTTLSSFPYRKEANLQEDELTEFEAATTQDFDINAEQLEQPVTGEPNKLSKRGDQEPGLNSLIQRIRKLHRRMVAPIDGQQIKIDAAKEQRRNPGFHLVELNITLTMELCKAGVMSSGSLSTRIICNIYLSRHFPLHNVTLHLSTDDETNQEFCGGTHYVSCPSEGLPEEKDNTISLQKRDAQVNSWTLPVGSYKKNSYRFRLISSNLLTEEQRLCSFVDGQHPFTEYVLVFHRRCDK